jgi:hypothetical protein
VIDFECVGRALRPLSAFPLSARRPAARRGNL